MKLTDFTTSLNDRVKTKAFDLRASKEEYLKFIDSHTILATSHISLETEDQVDPIITVQYVEG